MAGKKRGMSLEDKRSTILNIFHETKEVYLLKDMEKHASKRGVVLQSVKDVLQSLVDDDLVHGEKIGVSNYFWSFPSEAAVKLDTEITKLQSKLSTRKGEEAKLRDEVAKSQSGKEDSVCTFLHFQNSYRATVPRFINIYIPIVSIQVERQTLVRQTSLLEAEVQAGRSELSNYTANDPERYEALSKQLICVI